MKKIKYLLFTILVFSLVSLVACGGSDDPTSDVVTGDTLSPTTSITTTPSFTGDVNSLDTLIACINSSIGNPDYVETTTSIMDGQTEVYRRVITVSLEKGEALDATITIETYELNSNFTLEKSTKVETVKDLKAESLFTYKLDAQYFASYSVSNNGLTATVKATEAKNLLNSSSVTVSEDFLFSIALNNKRISSVNLNYKMDNKNVVISSVYSYFN